MMPRRRERRGVFLDETNPAKILSALKCGSQVDHKASSCVCVCVCGWTSIFNLWISIPTVFLSRFSSHIFDLFDPRPGDQFTVG